MSKMRNEQQQEIIQRIDFSHSFSFDFYLIQKRKPETNK